MQVEEIPRDVQLGHLPLAARQVLGPRRPSIEQNGAAIKLFARSYDHRVRADLAHFRHRIANRLLLFGADLDTSPELLQVNADHGPRYEHASGRLLFT